MRKSTFSREETVATEYEFCSYVCHFMGERIIAHWPPPYADPELLDDAEAELFTAVRSNLLDSVKGKKKSRIRTATPEQLVYQMHDVYEDDKKIELYFAIANQTYNDILGEVHDEDVAEIINCKLTPETRMQMAYVLFWSFADNMEDSIVTEKESSCQTADFCEDNQEDDDDEPDDPYELNLWTPESDLDLSSEDIEEESPRDRLKYLNALDAQMGVRDLYISIMFGRFGEQNGKNIAG